MKKIKVVSLLFLVLNSFFSIAQLPKANKITFISLNINAGYVIDSLENKKCNCIQYVDKKYFRHAAMIQLADSHVVMRVKRINTEGYTDVPLTEKMALDIRLLAASLDSGTSNEEALLKKIAGEGVEYFLLDYEQLKFPPLKIVDQQPLSSETKLQKRKLFYFQMGVGLGQNNAKWGDLAYGMEFGYVWKKNIIVLRNFKIIESDPILGDINPHEKISDFGILYGRTLDAGRVVLSGSAGISYVTGVLRGKFIYSTGNFFGSSNYEEIKFSSIGFPIQGELFIGAARNINFGIIGFANINSKNNFNGVLFCFRAGPVK